MASDENCMTVLVDEKIKNETKANQENQAGGLRVISTLVNDEERKTRKSGKKFKHEIKEKGNFCTWIYLIKSSLEAIIAKLQATIDNKDRELKLKEDKIKQMGKERASLIF